MVNLMNTSSSLMMNAIKKIKLAICFFIFAMLCMPAYSGITNCADKVTMIHIHGNGNIYFSTEKSCSQKWCMIDWVDSTDDSEGQLNRAYAALLAARTADRSITFYWNDEKLAKCGDTIEEDHISPLWIGY